MNNNMDETQVDVEALLLRAKLALDPFGDLGKDPHIIEPGFSYNNHIHPSELIKARRIRDTIQLYFENKIEAQDSIETTARFDLAETKEAKPFNVDEV